MAEVNPLTNAVNENIEQVLIDLREERSLSSTLKMMILRDVDAMMKGGASQGQHFVDGGQAWLSERVPSVVHTYLDMHNAYKDGWRRIADQLNRRIHDDRELDDIVRLQTCIAEGIALQGKNMALRSVEDDAQGLARALELLFFDVTHTPGNGAEM